jgi:hypothetical protein
MNDECCVIVSFETTYFSNRRFVRPYMIRRGSEALNMRYYIYNDRIVIKYIIFEWIEYTFSLCEIRLASLCIGAHACKMMAEADRADDTVYDDTLFQAPDSPGDNLVVLNHTTRTCSSYEQSSSWWHSQVGTNRQLDKSTLCGITATPITPCFLDVSYSTSSAGRLFL